eukprot:COSAG03_NODE_13161_length_514_cov_1.110843_1_plen_159_part_01
MNTHINPLCMGGGWGATRRLSRLRPLCSESSPSLLVTVRLTRRRLTFILPMLGAFTLVAVSLAAGAPPPAPPPAPGDSYSPFGVGKTAYDLVLDKLQERHEAIVALGNSSAGWRQRQQEVRASLRQLFAPLPPPNRTRTPGFVDGGNSTGDGFVLRKLL